MLICLVTFISTLLFFKDTEATLLKPGRQCVPTASVRGPCHVCVCSAEGVFHCRHQQCHSQTLERDRPIGDCEPDYIYRENNMFCTCDADGYWRSDNCEEKFKFLQPRVPVNYSRLRTNIKCNVNTLYLIDCNICQCAPNGYIDVTACTHRYCSQGHKADTCTYGDILRLDHEICSCSDINYYIDRLCVPIKNQVAQTLQASDIKKLVDIGRTWRRFQDLQADTCDPLTVYTVDCNNCVCVDGHLACTMRVCEQESKSALRHKKPKLKSEFETLPLLAHEGDSCEPGKKYRFKCNTCLCSADGTPSCTTMVCLEDFVLDIKALRGALSNS